MAKMSLSQVFLFSQDLFSRIAAREHARAVHCIAAASQTSVGTMPAAGGIAALLVVATASSVHARDILRRALEEAPSSGPCPQLLYGTGLHGAGEMNSVHAVESVSDCCAIALGALNGTWHCDGFTYQNDSRTCLLLREPLQPHTLNAENNTSGSWVQLPGPGPTPSPIPGPAPPLPPAPAAKPTMPSSPTFAKPPRPNIVLFFGDGEPTKLQVDKRPRMLSVLRLYARPVAHTS